jgi:glutaredoxin
MFFKGLRLVLMPFMLLWAKVGKPTGIIRATEVQESVNLECAKLALYHFQTCPFCIKVRHEMARLSLPIPLRDAQYEPKHSNNPKHHTNPNHKADLVQGGGKFQTPCLRIEDAQGNVRWLYESNDIIKYMQQRFA